jgi:hypothetical protein
MFITRQLLLPLYCYSANPVWILQARNEADLQVARMFSHADRGCVKSHIHRDAFLNTDSIGDPLMKQCYSYVKEVFSILLLYLASYHLNMKRLVSSNSNTLLNKITHTEAYWRHVVRQKFTDVSEDADCFGLLFDPNDGRSLFLRNANKPQPDWAVSHSRRQYSP